MKVVLIGPFPPLRGGISMFNHSLSNEFEKNHEVFRISFSLQYPKFLFPGKSQYSEFAGKPADRQSQAIAVRAQVHRSCKSKSNPHTGRPNSPPSPSGKTT